MVETKQKTSKDRVCEGIASAMVLVSLSLMLLGVVSTPFVLVAAAFETPAKKCQQTTP